MAFSLVTAISKAASGGRATTWAQSEGYTDGMMDTENA